jgi:hypothetical protein
VLLLLLLLDLDLFQFVIMGQVLVMRGVLGGRLEVRLLLVVMAAGRLKERLLHHFV